MPAVVAALGVVAVGLLLLATWPLGAPDGSASPAAGAGSPSAGIASPSPETPAPSDASTTLPTSSPPATPSAAPAWPPRPALPAGWAYELACDDDGEHCRLHLRDATGAERPGWPVRISGTCWQEEPVGGPDGTAYLPCSSGSRIIVHAVRLDGTVPAGWPARIKGEPWGVEVAPDGTVYVGAWASSSLRIHALRSDGTARPGWPRKLPGVVGGFTVAPDGAVVAWWYEGVAEDTIDLQARRTKYTTIEPDGKTRKGWPITSTGTASDAVVGQDGTVYYVSATGNVYGHDEKGRIVKGWPYQLRAATSTYAGPAGPWLRDDGRLMFVAQAWDEDGERPYALVTVLTTAGRVARGWPFRMAGRIEAPVCATPSWPWPLFDVAGDGTLYVAPWDGDRAAAVALDPDGRMVAGWPRRLHAGWIPSSIAATSGGGVDIGVADVTGMDGGCGDGAVEGQPQTVTLAADGSVVRDVGVSTFAEIYAALRPQRLRAAAGTAPFAAGQPIELMWSLVNTSRNPLVLPYASYWAEDDVAGAHVAGVEQLWLERLGPVRTVGCISSDLRRGTWYAVGGQVVGSPSPVTIAAGAGLERRMTLDPALTSCLAPGTYRLHLELHELGYDVETDVELDDDEFEPLAAVTIDFRIAGPPPTPSPSPSPRPTPTPSPTVPPASPIPSPSASLAP